MLSGLSVVGTAIVLREIVVWDWSGERNLVPVPEHTVAVEATWPDEEHTVEVEVILPDEEHTAGVEATWPGEERIAEDPESIASTRSLDCTHCGSSKSLADMER